MFHDFLRFAVSYEDALKFKASLAKLAHQNDLPSMSDVKSMAWMKKKLIRTVKRYTAGTTDQQTRAIIRRMAARNGKQ